MPKVDLTVAKKVLEKHREEIIKKYGIKQMGVGYKTEGGRLTDKIAIILYMDKTKKSELAQKGIAPAQQIEGIPVDVIEIPGGFRPRAGLKSS